MPAGRPSDYTQEIADSLCAELAEGVSMHRACEPDDMPNKRTVFRWLREKEEFRHQYEQAKAEAADFLAEEMLEIADDGTNDYMEKLVEEGKAPHYQYNGEHVQRSRLRVDARKWIASKLKPKKYGDHTRHEHSGEDGKPIEMKWTVEVVEPADANDPSPE